MRLSEDQLRVIWQSAGHDRAIGHEHFWERALSRRQFLGTAAAASGVAATASLWVPGQAEAAAPGPGTPRPIPGTVAPAAPFHVKLPGACQAPGRRSGALDYHRLQWLCRHRGYRRQWYWERQRPHLCSRYAFHDRNFPGH